MNSSSKLRSVLALIGFLVITFCAPAFGAFAPPGEWYAGLVKPSWNPPAWVFGPAWTLLYTLMAVAAWLVWKRGGFGGQKGPLTLYFIQLALNAVWTPVFFGAHELGWALVVILMLWLAIFATLLSFWRVRQMAGLLFVPYLAWVSFATALNFMLWRLNPAA
ncbi:TspO/MBR related protein [Prosthecobacter fusiformis]|uniref:TspO/MBR related protein n=1 Tax=Prosthecobacter fusiformis TaxID=48464 RepID=A0A4R7RYP0_9BACT|nr:TspO/MBR family protein [Prosthecobacter fusiformis]TDU70971.1 TspO/MBR related protein [Prosthecobacter fusiformis]